MRTQGLGRSRTGRRTGTSGSRALLGLALTGLLLAGCSSVGTSTESGADTAQAAPDELAGGDRGGVADTGAGLGDQPAENRPADPGADAGADAGAAGDGAAGDGQATGGLAAGTGVGSTTPDTGGRQVITSGEVDLVAGDPRAAADAVVRQVEDAGGRVDDRHETAAQADEGIAAKAALTLRLPTDAMTGLLAALDEIGEVARVDLGSDDVTTAAQDLDARIRAMQLSVARMEDLLARATTQEEILSAENTLTERQAALEGLVSERARIAEQVSLSTLRVSISTPPEPVAPEEPAPVEPEEESPQGFLGGLASGWSALLGVLGGVVTVLGLLLPWLALGGLITWGVLAVRRVLLRRRHATAPGAGAGGPGVGGPGAGGPGAGGPGAGGPGADGPGAGGPGAGGPEGGTPIAPEPSDPSDPRGRQPVGVG